MVGVMVPWLLPALLSFTGSPRCGWPAAPSVLRRNAPLRCPEPVSALAEGTWELTPPGAEPLATSTMRVAVAGKELHFESGGMARQASGAVTVRSGDTHVFCAAPETSFRASSSVSSSSRA